MVAGGRVRITLAEGSSTSMKASSTSNKPPRAARASAFLAKLLAGITRPVGLLGFTTTTTSAFAVSSRLSTSDTSCPSRFQAMPCSA